MACVRKAQDDERAAAFDRERERGGVSLFSTPFLLRANKSTTYRQNVLNLAQSLAEALDELRLADVNLTDRFAANQEQFYISDLDLNESGRGFAKVAFRTWLARTDRWKPESKTVAKLKESLIAECGKFTSASGAA